VQVDVAHAIAASEHVEGEGPAIVKGECHDILDRNKAFWRDNGGLRSRGADIHGVGEERLGGVDGLGGAATSGAAAGGIAAGPGGSRGVRGGRIGGWALGQLPRKRLKCGSDDGGRERGRRMRVSGQL
jgi:hypothetical protein